MAAQFSPPSLSFYLAAALYVPLYILYLSFFLNQVNVRNMHAQDCRKHVCMFVCKASGFNPLGGQLVLCVQHAVVLLH